MGESPSGSEKGKQAAGLVFDPSAAPATPTDAATVIVLRDEASGPPSIFCVKRHPKSSFMGGAVVFPGGKVDPQDGDPAFAGPSSSDATATAILVAAARETIEEAGLLPAHGAADAVRHVRARLVEGATFLEALKERELVLDFGRLVPFARWITPEAERRRFDARFFLMRLPDGQVAEPCQTETTTGFWAPASEVLARFAAGEIQLAPPTTRCLELLTAVESVEEAFALAARQSLQAICPRFVAGDPPMLVIPGDPEHTVAERYVEGPTRFVLRDGRFVSEDPA
ncbi:MAG: NUDIX domain-containing protein [Polyangiaceae bacterium]|nr:NUDIX domain-containing protein [Polyangiaceae bacterium]